MAIELVSLSSGEELALGESEEPTISADGKYVVFSSTATNLVSPDGNGDWDVFLRDLASGTTTLISVDSDEEQGNAESWDAAISSDGTAVAFQSFSTDLVDSDTNGFYDIFVRDLTTGTTERVSIDSIGGEANNDSYNPAISGDGRYVVFDSLANDLVSGDTNNAYDIFRHDRQTGTTERVSITDGEGETDNGKESRSAAISDDGNIVVFESDATNLVSGDSNGQRDVFFRDIGASTTVRISVADDATEADGDSWGGELGANGTYYVFTSNATNLIGAGNDTNGFSDIFLRDLLGGVNGTTERISVSSTGEEANGDSWGASVSSNGRYVTFQSTASNLVSSDTNGVADIFVRDRQTGTTKRVVAFDGEQGTGASTSAAISDDGSTIAFISAADNLVEHDDNTFADAFVASNPPSPPALTLGILAASSGLPDWEPRTGSSVMPVTPPDPSTTLVVWPNADGTVTYVIGHDFTYAITGEPTGGIVTDIEHRTSYNGTVLAQGSGLNHSLVQIYEYLSSDDTDALYPFFGYILNGDDTITSADTDDTELAGFVGDDVITAGDGDDEIDGGIGADTIDGGAGNDWIEGGAGADAIDGGSQTLWDVASYQSSPDAVEINLATATLKGGDAEGDTLTDIEGIAGSDLADQLTGDAGNNWFWGGLGDDVITGGDGDDTVSYENAPTSVTVDLGAGTATGGHGNDTLVGIEDVQGSAQGDVITGDANSNTIWGGPGSDTLDGAGGSDTVSYWEMHDAVNASLATGIGTVVGDGHDTLSNFEGVQGTKFADTLTGDAGDNYLEGRDGADKLDGGGNGTLGDYTVYWNSPGAVEVSLATGTGKGGDAEGDTLVDIENLVGSAFDDKLTGDANDNILEGLGGADTLDGGAHGELGDFADYSNSPGAVAVSLATGTGKGSDAEGDTLANIENLIGSDAADTLTGDANDNVIEGRAGADFTDGGGNGALGDTASYFSSPEAVQINLNFGTAAGGHAAGDSLGNIENLIGSAFDDQLTGDGGSNILSGGGGNDTLDGHGGFDTVTYADAASTVSASLDKEAASGAEIGSDTLKNLENIVGGAGGDNLEGNGYANVLTGNAGDDAISGLAGDDTLAGGSGSNMLDGGADTDTAVFDGDLADFKAIVITGGYRITDQRTGQPGGIHDVTNIEWFQFDDQTVDASGLPLNKAPTDIALSNDTVPENSANGTEIGTLTATDPDDPGETFTYALTDDAGGRFAIGGAGNDRIVVANGSLLDYETAKSHDVTVKVTDSASNTYSETITVDVSNVDGIFKDGTSSADTIYGTNEEDRLNGLAGNDKIYGLDDRDWIDGGTGSDTMVGGKGDDYYWVDRVTDVIVENPGEGTDYARFTYSFTIGSNYANVDVFIIDGSNPLTATGNDADNIIYGNDAANILYGLGGSDNLYGWQGPDIYYGGDGDDLINDWNNNIKWASADVQYGGRGNDNYQVDHADDQVIEYADEGIDRIDVLYSPASYTLPEHVEELTLSSISGTLIAIGNAANNVIVGNDLGNALYGLDGDDSIFGNSGNDILVGGAGADTLHGGTLDDNDTASYASDTVGVTVDLSDVGNPQVSAGEASGDVLRYIESLLGGTGGDTFKGDGMANTLAGGAGDDTLLGRGGDDILDGGADTDTASFADDTSGVSADLLLGTAAGIASGNDSLIAIENLVGGTGADSLKGDSNANDIRGGAGSDSLEGRAGDDVLEGGAGDDAIDGGDDTDTASYESDADGVIASLTLNTATGVGSGSDTLAGIENLIGGSGNDMLEGDGNANTLEGGAGDDQLSGLGGDDILIAGAGSNKIDGGTEDDLAVLSGLRANFDVGTTAEGFLLTDLRTGQPGGVHDAKNVEYFQFDNATIAAADLINTAPTAIALAPALVPEGSSTGVSAGKLTTTDANTVEAFTYQLTDNASGRFAIGGAMGDEVVVANGALLDYETATSHDVTVKVTDIAGNTYSKVITIQLSDVPANTITGTSRADLLVGSDGEDTIYGLAGNDTLEGRAYSDVLDGGLGIDSASYASDTAGVTVDLKAGTATGFNVGSDTLISIESVIGGSGDDTITGNDLATGQKLDGGAGDDTIEGGPGTDTLIGGIGWDLLSYANSTTNIKISLALTSAQVTGGAGTDTVSGFESLMGGQGNDTLTGSAGDNRVDGREGNDTINGGAGNDVLRGREGDDILIGGPGGDLIDGDEGSNTASYVGSTLGVTIDLAELGYQGGVGDGAGDKLYRVQNLIGSAKNDILTGDAEDNVIEGALGNDTLAGGANAAGGDTVSYRSARAAVTASLALQGTAQATGGGGTDIFSGFENLEGGSGVDKLTGDAGANKLIGNAGNDILHGGGANGAGDDTLDGGAGTADLADYSADTAGIDASLALGTANGAGIGSDTLANIENLTGGSGDDTIEASDASNKLIGGLGVDTLSYANTIGNVKISLAITSAQKTGGSASDTVSGFENLTGGKGHDTLTGSTGVNVISGGDGNDTIYGGIGGDTLYGDAGDDILIGGTGGDTLNGGGGNDTASYATSPNGVKVDLTLAGAQSSNEDASGDTLVDIDNLIGSAKVDELTGDEFDNVIEGGLGNDILKGGANGAYGDTLSYAGATTTVTVDLAASTVSGAAGVDTISGFENVAGGSGADTLKGDGGANKLFGNGGDDKLVGGAGDDLLDGGDGADTADYGSDTAGIAVHLDVGFAEGANIGYDTLSKIENAIGGSGNDSIEASNGNNVIDGGAGVDDTLIYQNTTKDLKVSLAITTAQATGGSGTDTIKGFEHLVGGSGNDTLTGSIDINKLYGQGGNDTLSGGTGVGSDYLYGEGDNDILIGGGGADTLDGGDGSDTASYVGSAFGVTVDLTAVGAQKGSGDEDGDTLISIENLTGSAKNDFLYGDGGDNVIEGGIGNDTLTGGANAAGGDTLSYRSATSTVKVTLALQGTAQSTGGGGIDTFNEFENLEGGRGADTLTGDANANVITGNAGNDIIDGGAGIDTLIGGLGNDTYYVDDPLDVIIELTGQGTDLVRSSAASYTLANDIENLILLGTADIDGSGNALANTLTGNSGANKLDGGAGADKMIGGAGNDSYVVDNVGDKITETSTGGTDSVATSVSYTLGSYLENLMLTGSDNINGTGNTLANAIQGNVGDNVLNGKAGNDLLLGGDGKDAFLFDTTLNALSNVDEIADFTLGEDEIWLENRIFTGLGTVVGTLAFDAFYLGADAHDVTDRILYDQGTGSLYYDRDGTGSALKIQFAELDPGLALQNTDFKVV